MANLFRSEIVGLADELRGDLVVQEFGLRLDTVETVYRVWSGGAAGRGIESDVVTPITPTPKVASAPRYDGEEGGKHETGDLYLKRISATYTIDELTGGHRQKHEEFFWRINGELYRVAAEPNEKYLGWRVHLRKVNRRRVT